MAKHNSVINEAFMLFDESVKQFVKDVGNRYKEVELPKVPEKRVRPAYIQPQAPEGIK